MEEFRGRHGEIIWKVKSIKRNVETLKFFRLENNYKR